MPERISKVAHEYAGRRLKVGDKFECEPQHVDLYLARGWIEPEAGDVSHETRAMSTDDGEYLTRDMQPRRRGRPPKGTQ